MKSIILAGAPRSGKTTLARQLQKETGFSYISGDALVSTFGGIFPQLGIAHGNGTEKTSEKLEDFLRVYLDQLSHYHNISFILDTTHLLPEQAARLAFDKKYKTIFLGYPNIARDEKIRHIRIHKTDHYDWTEGRSDDEMRMLVSRYIERSQKMEEACTLLGLYFINTGNDFAAAQRAARIFITKP